MELSLTVQQSSPSGRAHLSKLNPVCAAGFILFPPVLLSVETETAGDCPLHTAKWLLRLLDKKVTHQNSYPQHTALGPHSKGWLESCTPEEPGAPTYTSFMSLPCMWQILGLTWAGIRRFSLHHIPTKTLLQKVSMWTLLHPLQPFWLPEGSQQSSCPGGHGECPCCGM